MGTLKWSYSCSFLSPLQDLGTILFSNSKICIYYVSLLIIEFVCSISLTLFHAGGGIYAPPTTFWQFSPGRTYPRRLQVYSKFKFCNCRTYKIGPGSKKISYGAGEPAEVGWVVDFLLRFCLKIGCIFTFHEMR